jgi:hypothetical protein
MFTIKLYSHDSFRQKILQAESFTILRGDDGGAEITLHQADGDGIRYDVAPERPLANGDLRQFFGSAIIENAAGKTTEIIRLGPGNPNLPPRVSASLG